MGLDITERRRTSISTDFTHAAYRTLLEALFAQGYETRDYADADPAARHLILRHDVDMSLQAAEPIAAIERELDARACYFVLLRTEMYNPFADASRRSIARLLELGHAVGLHFDASLYGDDPLALDEAAANECAVLEAATGCPIAAISFHRPARSLLGHAEPVAGRLHAYQPKFFKQMGYCSDSRGAWHHGHPLQHEAVIAGGALQLLTHPIWWAPEQAEPVQSRLDGFARSRYELLREELGRNCMAYDPARPA